MGIVAQEKRLEQTKKENLKKIYDVLKEHPDIKKLKPEDEYIEIGVTLDHEVYAEEFKEWADDVYQLLLKHPNSFFITSYVKFHDGHEQPIAVVGYNRKEPQGAFKSRMRRKQKDILWSLFSEYTKSKYGITVFDFDLFLKDMLKISIDEFVSYLKELRDNGWTSNSK